MSARTGRSQEATLQLQRELTGGTDAQGSVEALPTDWSLNAGAIDVIRVTVPFSGTLPATDLPNEIRMLTHSRRADLAGLAWVVLSLSPNGRAAVVVPASFLAESTQGHLRLRRQLTEEGRIHGIVRLAAGVFKARSGAVILLLGAPDDGPVWFCEVEDPAEMLQTATGIDSMSSVGMRWRERHRTEGGQKRNGSSFLVPRADIAAAQFAWAVERYRDAPGAAAPLRAPHEILTELAGLEAEIFQGIRDLVGVLKR